MGHGDGYHAQSRIATSDFWQLSEDPNPVAVGLRPATRAYPRRIASEEGKRSVKIPVAL